MDGAPCYGDFWTEEKKKPIDTENLAEGTTCNYLY